MRVWAKPWTPSNPRNAYLSSRYQAEANPRIHAQEKHGAIKQHADPLSHNELKLKKNM